MNQREIVPAIGLPSDSNMYADDEVESFREQFHHFSENELEMAILQAKKDILDELKEYQVVEVQESKVTKEKVKPNSRKININVEERVCSEDTEILDESNESEETVQVMTTQRVLKSQPLIQNRVKIPCLMLK